MDEDRNVMPMDGQAGSQEGAGGPGVADAGHAWSGGRKREKSQQKRWGLMDVPFILFLGALCVFYIWLRNDYERLWREEQKLEVEVRSLRSESLVLSSELMRRSKESEVYKLTESKGLKLRESRTPPVKIDYKER